MCLFFSAASDEEWFIICCYLSWSEGRSSVSFLRAPSAQCRSCSTLPMGPGGILSCVSYSISGISDSLSEW